jgi:hypothetical protein
VSITQPAPGSFLVSPTELLITAEAFDSDGVQRVDFFEGTNYLGRSTNGAPFEFLWRQVPPGKYTLTTVAMDTRGYSTASSPLEFTCLLFAADFSEPSLDRWRIIDEGTIDAPSAWTVEAGKLRQTSNIHGPGPGALDGRAGTLLIWDDPSAKGWTDYEFSLKLQSRDDDGIGVVFRFKDPQNFYKLELDRRQNFRKLFKRVNGQETLLAGESGSYETNRELSLSILLAGPNLRLNLDGTPLFGNTVSDSTLPSGTIGLYCWANGGALFDHLTVGSQGDVVSPATPEIGNVFFPLPGVIGFNVTGAPNTRVIVEVSSNLTSWTVAATLTNHSGTVPFSEAHSRSVRNRFYRVVTEP